ncbi:tripartite tricarboxylate transporter permease [Oceanobacillus jeddahense]|uniref:Tripartite tricarboxylate transporter permease n=1 Tax=Oceanobacillus jeddahense TaxID=1462527 RepID=A0ABY5JQ99_9BACI|nr:tripartite tricarboxylate transporter permease [Oceanobacillus jeddahense]UUI02460.1 tripartite tricarboxylate transporter permease [Oceanobacillus jeddahense]
MSLINFSAVSEALGMLFSLEIVLYIIGGLIVGTVLGAIPGLSGTLGIALMLPITYYMEPISAIMFLSAIFTGGVYGGGITAVMLNVPGAPGAVATTLDGYPMTRQGKHNEALGIGLMSSVIGCLVGYLLVFVFLQPLGTFVLKFQAPEMMILTLFALSIISTIQGDILKTLIAGFLGLLLGTIGSTTFGRPRGTFGINELYEGIEIVPALMGLLAISELFFLVNRKFIVDSKTDIPKKSFRSIFAGMKISVKQKINTLRSSIIGLAIGLLPAAGATVASLVSYSQAQTFSKDKKSFGKGNPKGLVAAETANSASEGGSLGTMMTFGIPGGSAAAVLMAAFMVHGLTPGPFLIRDHLDLTYAVIIGNFFQGVFLLGIGLLFIWYFSRVVFIPTRLLIPIVTIFSLLGAFSVRMLYIDVIITILFAILALIMRKLDYPIIAILLGLILGASIDGELTRTILLYEGRYLELFQRPIFTIMLIITVIVFLIPVFQKLFNKNKAFSND